MLGNLGRKFFLNIGVSLVVVFVIIGAIFFIGLDIQTNSLYISETGSALGQRAKSIQDLAKLRGAAQEAAELVVEVEKRLPNENQILSWSSELQAMARRDDLSGFDLDFGSETLEDGGLKNNVFTINAEGNYPNIMRFLSDLEALEYFVNLSSVNVSGQGERYRVRIEGNIFFRQQNAK